MNHSAFRIEDVRIDVFTTGSLSPDALIRMTHLPTGMTVAGECNKNSPSQHKVRSKLYKDLEYLVNSYGTHSNLINEIVREKGRWTEKDLQEKIGKSFNLPKEHV